MNRVSIVKRLDAIEQGISSDVFITVWDGLPPIYVQISTGTGTDRKRELKLFDSMDDAEKFLEANYFGADPILMTMGRDVPSAEFHSYGL